MDIEDWINGLLGLSLKQITEVIKEKRYKPLLGHTYKSLEAELSDLRKFKTHFTELAKHNKMINVQHQIKMVGGKE